MWLMIVVVVCVCWSSCVVCDCLYCGVVVVFVVGCLCWLYVEIVGGIVVVVFGVGQFVGVVGVVVVVVFLFWYV